MFKTANDYKSEITQQMKTYIYNNYRKKNKQFNFQLYKILSIQSQFVTINYFQNINQYQNVIYIYI